MGVGENLGGVLAGFHPRPGGRGVVAAGAEGVTAPVVTGLGWAVDYLQSGTTGSAEADHGR